MCLDYICKVRRDVPHDAILCNDVHCHNSNHIADIMSYVSLIADACLQAAAAALPVVKQTGTLRCTPGWTEHIAPLRDKSIFWHNLWRDCDKPHDGLVAGITCKTRLQYHAAIRVACQSENDIVIKWFAAAIIGNNSRDFWQEVERLQSRGTNVSNIVDGLPSASDIPESFADRYSALYISLSQNVEEMSKIRKELNQRMFSSDAGSHCSVTAWEVLSTKKQLKAGVMVVLVCPLITSFMPVMSLGYTLL